MSCFSGNRRIKFEEFLSIFLTEKQKAREVTSQQFIETLGVFDKDNAGKVASGELRHVLTALGEFEGRRGGGGGGGVEKAWGRPDVIASCKSNKAATLLAGHLAV